MITSKHNLYWVSQICGWLIFVTLMGILNKLDGAEMNFDVLLTLSTTFVLGVISSHLYRKLILKLNWLKLKIVELIPRVIGASIVFGALFILVHTFVTETFIAGESFQLVWNEVLQLVLNLAVVFMLWSLLYFLFHFIRNYRKEEIKNLQWQALQNELELNKLKSQLNPHFIFNSMNIIRALVDEDPKKSKDSITRLSNILRSSLLMGRKKVISLQEELNLVNDYLNLESSRFEERLQLFFEIEESCKDHLVPPMLLQTLVENAIKHGISKLPEGGRVVIRAFKIETDLKLEIQNSGELEEKESENIGFGLENTKQRLNLLYGKKAYFSLKNIEQKEVLAEVLIPAETSRIKIEENESHYS
ncbi:MAG: histidine kinase [Vicingaceae bacterium]